MVRRRKKIWVLKGVLEALKTADWHSKRGDKKCLG